MNIKYKIIENIESNRSIVVRYYTDLITEDMLAIQRDDEGNILRCATDSSIDIPIPTPSNTELRKLILQNAHRGWLNTKEKLLDPLVVPMPEIDLLLNVEETELITLDEAKIGAESYINNVADQVIYEYIGNRATEYEQVDKEVQDYIASNYTNIPSKAITAWAEVAGLSNPEAADSIAVKSAAWRNILDDLRAERLYKIRDIKAALDIDAIDVIKSNWDTYCNLLKASS